MQNMATAAAPKEVSPLEWIGAAAVVGPKEGRKEGSLMLGLCATLLAPSSIDAWRATWGVSD